MPDSLVHGVLHQVNNQFFLLLSGFLSGGSLVLRTLNFLDLVLDVSHELQVLAKLRVYEFLN